MTGLGFWALLPSWPGQHLEVGGGTPTAPGHLSQQAGPWGGRYPVLPAQVPRLLHDQNPNCTTPFIQTESPVSRCIEMEIQSSGAETAVSWGKG